MNVFESKFFAPAILLLSLVLIGLIFQNVIIDKISDRVIEKISKPYSPSPFGPGFDPDKLDGYRGTSFNLENIESIANENKWERNWEYDRD